MTQSIEIAWIAAYSVLNLLAGAHALLNKRDPRAAWGWISVCVLFPLFGAFLYLLFGVNRIETRAKRLGIKPSRDLAATRAGATNVAEAELPANLRAVARTATALSGLPLLPGNHVEVLHNGEAAYPRMLAAIDAATKSIALASYLFDSDSTGHAFVDALTRASRRGVRVRCLVDGLGEIYTRPRISTLLEAAGVPFARFNPLQLIPPALHINLRNHRKLLLVDGCLAFTGGMNISQRHLMDNPANPDRVSDLHFALQGPIIDQLQRTFAEDWRYAADEDWACPPLVTASDGTSICRVIADGPNEDLDHLRLLLLAAISAAQSRIAIMTPYFLPSTELVTALQTAALRGVDTRIILPEHGDSRVVQWASEHMLAPLLERGVRIYRRPPPFAHTKLLLIDDCYTLIGSANLDPRSLRLNFELNVEAYDPALNAELGAYFERAGTEAREVAMTEVARRGIGKRLRNAACWLFSPYL